MFRSSTAIRTHSSSRDGENGEEPTQAQIAQASGLPESKVAELISLMPEVFSLDIPTGEGEEGSLHTLLEDIQAPQPYEELVRRELVNTMEMLLSMLNERQQQILRLHFGMEDGNCYSLEEIGIFAFWDEACRYTEYYGGRAMEYHIIFFESGLNAVICKWLEGGCREIPEKMAEVIISEYGPKGSHTPGGTPLTGVS